MYIRVFWVMVLITITGSFASGSHAQNFHIGPGDILEISVWKDENLSRDVIVPPDYVISFPLVGDLYVKQTSVGKLRKMVAKKLSEFIPEPSVTVMLKEINSWKAYVIGKVTNPGVFAIDMETSVMQVLAMAGGLNPFASEDDVHILRNQGGKTVKIPFDYGKVLSGKNLEQNITLQRGDVIVVP